MATKTVEKQEFKMKEVFALWKKESKNGTPYFSGKTEEGAYITGFFNTNKKNPKEPDLRVYLNTDDGIEKDPLISMWCNVAKSGRKYLTGKLGDLRIVGFISDGKNDKAPYVKCYVSEDIQQKLEEPAEEPKKAKKSKSEDLPF